MREQQIILPYAPRKVFKPYHARTERFAAGVAHRRCGKTVAVLNDQIRRAALHTREFPPGRFAYVGPYLNQSKRNVWFYLKHYARPLIADKHEGELWVDLLNGARITLYGADNPDGIRGSYLDDVIMDEFSEQPPSIWGQVIRPMLSDYQGTATFIATPKGRNSFYKLYEKAKKRSDWFTFNLPASLTGIIPEHELVAAQEDMTPEEFAQEYECSFDAAILGAYYAKEIAEAERAGRVTSVPVDVEQPVHRAWDLGVGDATVIWFFQVAGAQIHVVDHYASSGKGAQHYVQEAKAREASGRYKAGFDFVPHDAKVREFTSGAVPRQRIEVLQALGLNLRIVPDHKRMDGINAARVTMGRCWFDFDRTRDGLEALRQYRTEWDEKASVFRDTPKHDWTSDHADAFRYLAMAWRELSPADRPVTMKEKLAELVRPPTLDEMLADADAEEW